jgi:hypothetical protein
MSHHVETAKKILTANTAVLYGVFGAIDSSGFFPPRKFLNEFLAQGSDPCDQDGRMGRWPSFSLSTEDYAEIKKWWLTNHTDAREDNLGAESWDEWVQMILDD